MAPTVKDNLIAAKKLIDSPEKWGKGDWRDAGGCLCALAAANVASTGRADTVRWEVEIALEAGVPSGFTVNDGTRRVPTYNDHPDTTYADIMAMYDRAIAAQDGVS